MNKSYIASKKIFSIDLDMVLVADGKTKQESDVERSMILTVRRCSGSRTLGPSHVILKTQTLNPTPRPIVHFSGCRVQVLSNCTVQGNSSKIFLKFLPITK